ncbi:hypothetical protein B0T25DRAFT_107598 [Lasiosphaeria hispida]|uniref:Uncharacterized protein n=1 Tax=Lasiosphaeria hispida TaxID=260671 RepID=A0AAJ0HR65_9PEZI|nr:hypothetical protein B0T25DRAFT_107598 [Lasiosphaeria hispida]
MNPQQGLKPPSPLDIHTIDMDTQEKTSLRRHRKQSMPHSQQRLASSRRLSPIQRIILSVSVCLLILFGLALTPSPRDIRRMGCHQQQVADEIAEVESSSFSSLLNTASPEGLRELLHKNFPEWFQPGVASDRHAMEAIHRADTPLATTILTLARRADNSTTTSTTSTQTTTSNPPEDTTSSKSTTSPNTTPSSTSPPATTTSSKSTTPGTTLTTSTTLDPTTTSYSTSKLTTQTFTSTSNGEVIIVTATSYVGVDPVETSAQTTTKPPPSLQNNAMQQGYSGQLFTVVMGVAVGMLLL